MKLIEYEMKTSKTDNKNIVVCSDISKYVANKNFNNILKVFNDIINRPGIFHRTTIENVKILRK